MPLECFVLDSATAPGWLKGDHVIVDWSGRPRAGEIGAIRTGLATVRFARCSDESQYIIMGRLVRSTELLKVSQLQPVTKTG